MIYIFLADGFEEMEAIVTTDILRRAGLQVMTVGVSSKCVTGAHGIPVVADVPESEISLSEMEALVLPGGMPGTLHLEASQAVQAAIDFAYQKNKLIAAICAAPSILGHKGILRGKKAVCFPGFEEQLEGAFVGGERVVVDGNIVTAKGAACAIDFALALVSILVSSEKSDLIRASLQ